MRKLLNIKLLFLFIVVVACGTLAYDLVVTTVEYDKIEKRIEELVLPIARIRGQAEVGGRTVQWSGSGVVIYSEQNELGAGFDTYVLTCNHCVEVPVYTENPYSPTSYKYEVEYVELFDKPNGDSRKVSGQVVAQSNNNIFTENKDGDIVVDAGPDSIDPKTGLRAGEDLALVRLDTTEKIPTVKLMSRKSISKLRLFLRARVVGCSLGGRPYHTQGEITVLDNGYMSVNAPYVPGNSGGAAYLDDTHEFLGITNAGISPVWHMGLIRPLKRIYDWLDSEKYTFIYEKSVDGKRKIRSDKDSQARAEKERFNKLSVKVDRTHNSLQSLINKVDNVITRINQIEREVNNQVSEMYSTEQCLLEEIANTVSKIRLLSKAVAEIQNLLSLSRRVSNMR